MPRANQRVLQFRVELQGIKPPIWRRIQVPEEYTFWDLHVAIQDAMGWEDRHLHQFQVPVDGEEEVLFSFPDEDGWSDQEIWTSWEHRIRDYFEGPGDRAQYWYDFGDDWMHDLLFEGESPAEKGARYPLCLAGERACPPEDIGGIPGYEELVSGDPEIAEWSQDYDPEAFNPKAVRFWNPKRRLEMALGDEE